MTTCRLYGLDVSSPFVLGHVVREADGADVHISVDDAVMRAVDAGEPAGRLIATNAPETPRYALVDRGSAGYLYRFHGLVDVEISADGRRLHCTLAAGASREMLPVILSGYVMATVLMLRGELVLHASAVERDGTAVALVGNSGAGKSTSAAMACLSGCRLVSDDVLRAEPTATGASCYRGTPALRLRAGSQAVGEATAELREISADGRHLFAGSPTEHDRLPLGAIFVLRLRESDHPVSRTALDPKAAFFALLGHPRVRQWADAASSAQHFARLTAVSERVPVYLLDLPWGVTLGSEWRARLVDALFEGRS